LVALLATHAEATSIPIPRTIKPNNPCGLQKANQRKFDISEMAMSAPTTPKDTIASIRRIQAALFNRVFFSFIICPASFVEF
jgi:hypothetical protein